MDGSRRWGSASWFIAYTLFMVMVGPNVPSPLYELYRKNWHLSAGMITLLFATYPLVLLPCLLLVGPLSDRVERRTILVPGLVIAEAGSMCFALAHAIAWLFVARALQGIAVGSTIGTLTAMLVELHPQQQRHEAPVLASLAVAAGGAVGPVLAGILAQYAPHPTSIPYLVHLLLLMPTLLGVWMMPETIPRQPGRQKRPIPSSRLSVLGGLPFALGSITAFVAWAVIALFVALAPTYVAIFLHVQDLTIIGGTVFLLLGASAVTQALLRDLPAQRAIVTGIVLLLIGLGSVIVAVPIHSLALLLAGMIANGIGHGLAWMGSLALVILTVPSARRGESLARFYVVMYLGVGLPVIGVGFLTAWIGLYGAIAVFAGTIGIVGSSLAALISKVPQEA